ncbi:MAG: signal peptidase I [Candidatus Azobacteroides sp.]|nr:signal peptidase I [Candidatus Azobacteroides sp.]
MKTFLLAFIIAGFLRTFLIESYRIPAHSMENTLLEGDNIFVNKTSYGIRFPITPVSLPFFYDSIPFIGLKSYANMYFPYFRLFSGEVRRNDVVVFNKPSERTDIPVNKRKISISRCLALPGDSLVFEEDIVYVNGQALPQSPNVLEPYYFSDKDEFLIKSVLVSLQIPVRRVAEIENMKVYLFSRYEMFLLREELPDTIRLNVVRPKYNLIVPKKDIEIEITNENYYIYLPLITAIEQKNVRYENNQLWVDGKKVDKFRFEQNYFWMLPDNRLTYIDKDFASFIPETHLIGKAMYVWNRGFKKIR